MNEDIMRQAGFNDEMNKVKQGKCPHCDKPVIIQDFRNEISRREFKISGLCQKCQDEIFGDN